MKKLISIFIISILLFVTAGCSCGMSCCGAKQNVPTAKGEVSIAYDNALIGDLLAYFQANQGYTVTGVLLDAETDYTAVGAPVAVVKNAAYIERLTAAGWAETGHWTEAQKTNNDAYFGFTVLEAPNASSESAIKALVNWLGGSEAKELSGNDLFKALLAN